MGLVSCETKTSSTIVFCIGTPKLVRTTEFVGRITLVNFVTVRTIVPTGPTLEVKAPGCPMFEASDVGKLRLGDTIIVERTVVTEGLGGTELVG